MKRIAIIGAGIAGLSAARLLQEHHHVTLFDKSRGVSGRMATRREDPYQFDHGAQFFTVRDPAFRKLIHDAETAGVVTEWQTGIHQLSHAGLSVKGQSDGWFVAQPTMTALAKYLATDLALNLASEISTTEYRDNAWYLTDTQQQTYGPFDWLISAIPHRQFMWLFANTFEKWKALSKVRMSGCFSLMIGGSDIPEPDFAIARVTGSPINLVVNNARKPNRPADTSIMVHSSNDWAERHIDDELEAVQSQLLSELEQLMDVDYGSADHIAVHRWRYALVEKPYKKPFYQHPTLPLFACGDWCIGPRVECAFLSGRSLAQHILR